MVTEAPSYEAMVVGATPLRDFITNLTPGEPQRLPMANGTADTRVRYARRLAADLGVPVVVKLHEGTWWIVRLRPEDVR